MPYKRDGSDAPDDISALPAKKRRAWISVFNSSLKQCEDDDGDDCEARAFAQANSVVLGEAAALRSYQYNGVEVRASRRRASDRADKKYMRDVGDGDRTRVVHYGDPELPMQRDNPERRANFLARHNCKEKSDPFAPGFWACYDWQNVNEESEVDMEDTENLEVLETTADETAPVEDAAPLEVEAATPEAEAPEANPTPGDPEDPTAVVAVTEAKGIEAAIQHLRAALAALAMDEPDEPEAPAAPSMEAAETFAESAAPLALVESTPPANRRAPLDLDVGIIRVGPGNKRDNHYYTREMLERDGAVFKGAKMYATDHRNDEKSVRTEVSLIREVLGVKDFQDGAYLTGRVAVFNPDFAEDIRNRADAGVLDSLHCSILAQGEAEAREVDGAPYNVVTRITEAQSVDWVTRAGAGGHALALAESAVTVEVEEEPGMQELNEDAVTPRPVTLSEDAESIEEVIPSLTLAAVITALGETNLPAASVAQLANVPYHDLAEVQAAVTAEVTRLKAAGSGQPLGFSKPAPPQPKTIQEIQAEQKAVNQKWLGGR